MAGIIAIFMNKVGGGALPKTLGRIQGTVIGAVAGEIAYSYFGYCTWWGHLFLLMSLFIWATMSLFIYHHSKQYQNAYCGLLLAIFGTRHMLADHCSSDDHDIPPAV